MTNPAKVKVTGVFYVDIDTKFTSGSAKDVHDLIYNYNNMITPLVQAGTLTNIAVTRTVATVYKVAQMKFSFTLQNSMDNADYLLIQFPNQVVLKDTANAYTIKRFSDSAQSTLLRECTTSLTTQYNSDDFLEHLRISGLCAGDCAAGVTIHLAIEGVRNNYFIP